MTSVSVSQDAPVGRNDFVFPQAPTTDAATPKETLEDVQAPSIGVPQGARDKPNIPASTLPPATDAGTPKETLQGFRAVASAGAAAAQIVSAVAQETHIAPAVQPTLGQGARYRAERMTDARDRSAPEQGTEQGDTEVLAARGDVLSANKPLRASPVQLASVGRSASEQGATGNADGELSSFGPPADHSVSGIASELPRATGDVPQPLHQVAGQIVAGALAIQREEAQPIAALAAKPLASSVVKILHLELQPEDLGTITIRMSLKQDALDIRVEASRYDTACMLQRDQDSLAKILTSVGYRIDGMTVVTAATDGAAVSDGRSQAFLPSSTPQHGGASQQDSRSSGGRSNAESSPRSSPGKQNDDNDKSRTARGTGGDLYV
jgi:hypothetical protein